MKEKIKIILQNTQMRNLIYLFLGFMSAFILLLIYNPNLEYRRFDDIVDEDNIKIIKNYSQILEDYSTYNTYTYIIYYKDYVISGYSIANTYYDDIEVEEIKEYEELIKPNIIYEKIKNLNYTKEDNKYNYGNIVIELEKDKVKKLKYNDLVIEYGG